MMARNCRSIRRQLSAFHDGELPVGEQIAVQAHLRECLACAGEARDLESIGGSLRAGSPALGVDPDEFAGLPSLVVSRMKAEEAQSLLGWTGRVFEDLHLVWAALGATGATVLSVAIICSIFYYFVPPQVGTNQNPYVVDQHMTLPSVNPWDSFPAATSSDEDGELVALAAVVTREGKMRDPKVVRLDQRSDGETETEKSVREALSKARLSPARYGTSPVAVSMVWLYAQLTVVGKAPEAKPRPRTPARPTISTPFRVRSPKVLSV